MVRRKGGRPLSETPPDNWYLAVADHLGACYLDLEFCRGTGQEVDFVHRALSLRPGARLLDVGCGPGRHAIELARKGVQVVGVDLSSGFLDLARERASEEGVSIGLFEMDAVNLPFEDEFDAAISLSEGAFGLGLDDLAILRGIARALKPGGHAAVAAPHTFHMLGRVGEGSSFDPVSSVFATTGRVPGEDGSIRALRMYNSCFTPRELEWMANGAGLDPEAVSGIHPGRFGSEVPTADHPELLLLARKPGD